VKISERGGIAIFKNKIKKSKCPIFFKKDLSVNEDQTPQFQQLLNFLFVTFVSSFHQ